MFAIANENPMNTEFWTAGRIIAIGSFLLLLDVYMRATVFLAVALLLVAGVPWLAVSCVRATGRKAKLRRANHIAAPRVAAADIPPNS